MRVLVCGSRFWMNAVAIRSRLAVLPADAVVIHGGARGADRLAEAEAKARGLTVDPYPADWQRFGPAAGPLRNRKMLTVGRPDVVVAFHNAIWTSKGTRNCLKQARRLGIATELVVTSGPCCNGQGEG